MRTLRASGVTAGYGGDPVIRNITVRADPGEVVSLVGANGSGKSTLLKSLVGVVRVTAGTVTVGDTDVTRKAPEEVARAGVGYVPQVDDVFAYLRLLRSEETGIAGSCPSCEAPQARGRGVLRLEGRDYEMRDGDVITVKFTP